MEGTKEFLNALEALAVAKPRTAGMQSQNKEKQQAGNVAEDTIQSPLPCKSSGISIHAIPEALFCANVCSLRDNEDIVQIIGVAELNHIFFLCNYLILQLARQSVALYEQRDYEGGT
jgi:hypothetical protein